MVDFSQSGACLIVRVDNSVYGHISAAGFHTSREMLETDPGGLLWVAPEDFQIIMNMTKLVMANGSSTESCRRA